MCNKEIKFISFIEILCDENIVYWIKVLKFIYILHTLILVYVWISRNFNVKYNDLGANVASKIKIICKVAFYNCGYLNSRTNFRNSVSDVNLNFLWKSLNFVSSIYFFDHAFNGNRKLILI